MTPENNTPAGVPDGYMKNGQGHLVPIELVAPIDRARDDLVREMVQGAKELQVAMAEFKRKWFGDVNAFASMSAEKYGASLGGKKGNITLHTFDGSLKVQLASADNIVFDERLQAAKELVDACINEWAEGSRPEIKAIVQKAFDTDKEGKLNTGRVLSLRSLEIKDEKWRQAMQAISDSVQVVGSKQYIRFYQRVEGTDEFTAIVLDLAGV